VYLAESSAVPAGSRVVALNSDHHGPGARVSRITVGRQIGSWLDRRDPFDKEQPTDRISHDHELADAQRQRVSPIEEPSHQTGRREMRRRETGRRETSEQRTGHEQPVTWGQRRQHAGAFDNHAERAPRPPRDSSEEADDRHHDSLALTRSGAPRTGSPPTARGSLQIAANIVGTPRRGVVTTV
jgi:hypothetical protein